MINDVKCCGSTLSWDHKVGVCCAQEILFPWLWHCRRFEWDMEMLSEGIPYRENMTEVINGDSKHCVSDCKTITIETVLQDLQGVYKTPSIKFGI